MEWYLKASKIRNELKSDECIPKFVQDDIFIPNGNLNMAFLRWTIMAKK